MNYHYSNGSEDLGEFSIEEIQRRINEDPQGQHLVWREGMGNWGNATDLPEFSPPETVEKSDVQDNEPESANPTENRADGTDSVAPISPEDKSKQSDPSKKSKRGMYIGIAAIGIGLVVILMLLLQKSTYEKGVDLVKEGKYEEAMATFAEAEPGDDDYLRCGVGGMVAEMAKFYEEEKYDEAMEILYSSHSLEGEDGHRAYDIHLKPDDALYPSAASIGMLVEAQGAMNTIHTFLNADNSDMEGYFEGESEINVVLPGVLSTGEYQPEYHDVDTMMFGWEVDKPYILHTKFDKLVPPDRLASEVKDIKAKLEALKPKVDAKIKEYNEYVELMEAYQASVNFNSEQEARDWLSAGSGIWLQDVPIFDRTKGMEVRMFYIFKFSPYSTTGTITLGSVDASSLRDVEQRVTKQTWIVSVDENSVTYTIGSEWLESVLVRSAQDMAISKTFGLMTRQ